MTTEIQGRDIIVIGASAGGVQAVGDLVAELPPDLPAAVFVVVHIAAGYPSLLPDVLANRGPLRVSHPLHGEEIVRGRIYVAPPDNHVLVRPGYVHVVRGPKENGHRPAVDALFRTAAAAYGPRVVGVVLTGYLDCGTAGLMSIKARRGVAIAQDPEEAEVPHMPRSAIQHVPIDHVARVAEIPALLARLAQQPFGPVGPPLRSSALSELEGDEPGAPVRVVCPQCQGALSLAELGGFQFFRCHVGHTFSLDGLLQEQGEEVERALWAASRALEEAADITRRARSSARGELARRLTEKEEVQARQAQVIREMLLLRSGSEPASASAVASPGEEAGARDPM